MSIRDSNSGEYVFSYILLKLAMRCNLDCTYCYWFTDESVYRKPAILRQDVEEAFIERLAAHVTKYELDEFYILLHGGEPLLFGKDRFLSFGYHLRQLEKRLNFRLQLGVTTNGVLIDAEWADILRALKVGVTVSIDGPQAIHDRYRVDFRGRGTFDRVLPAFAILRKAGIEPGVLAVCNPDRDPHELIRFFVDTVGSKRFDILVPDTNHEQPRSPIARFYTRLFDLWYDRYAQEGVEIRFIDSITKGLLGRESHSESIGYGPITTFTMLTDGSLEPLDVARTAGTAFTRTEYNILTHDFQSVQGDPLWRELYSASLNLAPACRRCSYHFACGGGHIASRWSKVNRFDNPSSYCDDFKQIFSHAWERIIPDLEIELQPVGPPGDASIRSPTV